MADSRAKEIIKQADRMFGACGNRNSLWQEIAENFYPERADFTRDRAHNEEIASHLFGSYPVLARRELANLFASMLRPRAINWFSLHTSDEELDEDKEVRQYLEDMDKTTRRAMYDADAQFVPVTRMADHDFASFGNAVLEGGVNSRGDALLYRNHHLRDCVWAENSDGEVDVLYRKWCPTADQLIQLYGDRVSEKTKKAFKKDPQAVIDCFHAIVPNRIYRPDRNGRREYPFTCLYIEKEGEHVLEETPEAWFRFVVPRWEQEPGTPYAHSPATAIILPDARSFQVVIRTLREAGEMAVNPPMAMAVDAFRSDAEFFPGGLTAADIEMVQDAGGIDKLMSPVYGKNSGAELRPGFEIAQALRDDIRLGFFLDKIRLPDINTKTMTAYEFQQRLKEHIRQSAPLFEPIADQYNAKLCELTFNILKSMNAYGPRENVPEKLSGQRVEFKIRSPLYEAEGQAKSGLFAHILQTVVGPAMQVDPAQVANLDLTTAVRDALRGLDVPADWMNDEELVKQAQDAAAQQKKMMAGIEALGQGGDAAKAIGEGLGALGGAGS